MKSSCCSLVLFGQTLIDLFTLLNVKFHLKTFFVVLIEKEHEVKGAEVTL